MGLFSTTKTKKYTVTVKTGKAEKSGTNATIKIVLVDESGKSSEKFSLNRLFYNDFEYGREDDYGVHTEEDFGNLHAIILHRDKIGLYDDWFVEHVAVHHELEGKIHFPLNRWMPANKPMHFEKYDSQLPQIVKANNPGLYKQREDELKVKQKNFHYAPIGGMKGMPRSVTTLPPEEVFSKDYTKEVGLTKLGSQVSGFLNSLRYPSEFNSFADFYQLFFGRINVFDVPSGHQNWRSDEKFAALRLIGPNCTKIRGCKKDGGIPKKFKVEEEKISLFLEGKSLAEQIEADKLFYVTYQDLEEYVMPANNEPMVCPFALFYSRCDGVLVPIAIQLFQEPSEDNPVFYPPPIDEETLWLLAKFWFGVADSNYHEPVTHLMETHMVAGDFITCFHHSISPSHPIYKLLLPHFIFLLHINTKGLPVLTGATGTFNKVLMLGKENCDALMLKKYQQYSLKEDGWLDAEIENRGVGNLANYHYYEDGKLIFDAIHDYMKDCINTIYDGEDDNLAQDFEMQNFAKMLSDPEEGMKGVWGDGKFEKLDDLIKTVTSIVYILSCAHSAANFNQYDEYGFQPNFPFKLNGSPPKNKDSVTELELVKLFDVDITIETLKLGRVLSTQGTNKIGNYEVQYEYKPAIHAHYQKFYERLQVIAKENDEKNAKRRFAYPWLSPKVVPNSISI
eukprot:TCONS_00050503-protein